MPKVMFLIWTFVLAFAGVAAADSIGFTVTGSGGLSPAVAGVSANSFWWAGTGPQGTVPGSVLTGYGFDPLSGSFQGVTPPPYSHNDLYTGSLLLSTPFTVNGTQGVTVNFGELSAQQFAYGNFEFAVLLQNSQTAAILGIVSPVATLVGTEDQNSLGTLFTPLSPGVHLTVNYANAAYPESFQLGGTQFACTGTAGDFQGPCQGDFTSAYTPARGTYQLLFGAYGQYPRNGPTAVAVKSVSVPEGDTWADLLVSVLALSLACWRWRSVGLHASTPVQTGVN